MHSQAAVRSQAEPWPMWLAWLERRLVDRRVASSVPSRGMCEEATDSCFSLCLPSPFSKSVEKMSSSEDKKSYYFLNHKLRLRALKGERGFGEHLSPDTVGSRAHSGIAGGSVEGGSSAGTSVSSGGRTGWVCGDWGRGAGTLEHGHLPNSCSTSSVLHFRLSSLSP